MILTIALLLMCIAGIGTLVLLSQLFAMVRDIYFTTACIHGQVHDYVEDGEARQTGLIESLLQDGRKTHRDIKQSAKESVESITFLMDGSYDAATATEALRKEVVKGFAKTREAIANDGKMTRKESQEIKTALRDDEKDDQRAKSKTRNKKTTH